MNATATTYENEAPEMTEQSNYTATYSPQDNKLRLYSVSRLDSETYAEARKLGFIYAPKQGFIVAPMWTPGREDWLLKLAGSIEDEDSTTEERAADRAERFNGYSDKRGAERVIIKKKKQKLGARERKAAQAARAAADTE